MTPTCASNRFASSAVRSRARWAGAPPSYARRIFITASFRRQTGANFVAVGKREHPPRPVAVGTAEGHEEAGPMAPQSAVLPIRDLCPAARGTPALPGRGLQHDDRDVRSG